MYIDVHTYILYIVIATLDIELELGWGCRYHVGVADSTSYTLLRPNFSLQHGLDQCICYYTHDSNDIPIMPWALHSVRNAAHDRCSDDTTTIV